MSAQRRVAEDATFQIECAMEYLNWLRGVLAVVRDRLSESEADSAYSTTVGLAIYNANDWHNQLDCERESLTERINVAFADATPQNGEFANRGAEVEGGQ